MIPSLITWLLLSSLTVARCDEKVQLTTGLRVEPVQKIIHQASVNLIYQINVPNLSEFLTVYACTHDEDICEILDHVKKITKETLKLLEHALPQPQDMDLLPNPRRTRALDFIASGLSWCCGVSTQTELDDLTQRHENLESMANTLRKQIVSEHDTAIKQTTLVNQYSKEMQKLIESEFRKNDLFRQQSVKNAGELGEQVGVLQDTSSVLAKTIHRISIAIYWVKLLEQCHNKQLPAVLVHNETLKNDLLELQRNLLLHDQDLAIDIKNLQAYFHIKASKCFMTEKAVFINTRIPIITRGNKFQLYKITALPLTFEEKLCSIPLPEHLVVQKNGKELISLDQMQEQTCINDDLCYIGRYPSHISHNMLCLELAFSSKATTSQLRKACAFKCSKLNTEAPYIMQLSHKEFAILYPNNTITISCDNQTDKIISTKDQVGAVVISLLCTCHILVGKQKIFADYPCKRDEYDEISAVHIMPASWSSTLEDQLISHHTLFNNQSAILDRNWVDKVPILDLSTNPLPHFEPDTHMRNAPYISYTTLGIVIVIIAVIIVIIWKGKGILNALNFLLDPSKIAEFVLSAIFTRAPVAQAESNTKIEVKTWPGYHFIFLEYVELCLLSAILIIMAIILYKLIKSNLLSLFSNKLPKYNAAKIKLTTINTEDPSAHAFSISHENRPKITKVKNKNSTKFDTLFSELQEKAAAISNEKNLMNNPVDHVKVQSQSQPQ